MNIHNELPLLLECLRRWEQCPSESVFKREYADPMQDVVGDFFDGFHEVLLGLNWGLYRGEGLRIDSAREETRLQNCIRKVEKLFGFELLGDVVLMGAFTAMDGYARFDRGSHTVFLGVDESHGRGQYLDILFTHELTHVARESRPEVWEGFGLNPKMTQEEFTESQPVIEHLMGEGFSCAVSEILVPGQPLWNYAYQSKDSLAQVLEHGPRLDQMIRKELQKADGDYGRLYRIQPVFSHYVWAWQWVKGLIHQFAGGDPKKLVSRCSKDFMDHAMVFRLTKV